MVYFEVFFVVFPPRSYSRYSMVFSAVLLLIFSCRPPQFLFPRFPPGAVLWSSPCAVSPLLLLHRPCFCVLARKAVPVNSSNE